MTTGTAPVLVTGATGFVGSAVVRNLLDNGYRIRALVRTGSCMDNLAGLTLERVVGDLRDIDSLHHAMLGCRGVFHVAADYRLWVPDPEAMHASNIEGSRNVLAAARQVGVARIVYTSSVATLRPHHDHSPATEDDTASLDDMIGDYKRSKWLAEQTVIKLAREWQLNVVIVQPAAPVGPHDIKPTPTGRMVLDVVRGHIPAYVDSGLDIVHVDDVAQGHRLAFEHAPSGRRYILGGDNLCLRDIFRQVARIAGRHGPWLRVPHALVLPAAWVAEARAKISHDTPSITVAGARLARKHMYFSHQRAHDELGYDPRPGAVALRDAARWFMENQSRF